MKDETLERIWKSRKRISARCDFDSHKLVKYYQDRQKSKVNQEKQSSETAAQSQNGGI